MFKSILIVGLSIFLVVAIWRNGIGGDDNAKAQGSPPTATATTDTGKAPAYTPTPVPVQPTTAPSQAAASAACPTDGQMQAMFGFDKMNPPIKPVFSGQNVAWEPCKWSLQWTGPGTLPLTMLGNWQFTSTMADDSVVVWYGDGQVRNVKGATIRYTPAYVGNAGSWVTDGCTLLSKENDFGHGRNPSYETVNGNVCNGGKSQPALTSTTSSGNQPATANQCPTTAAQAASLLSGGVGNWTDLGSDSGTHKWKFNVAGQADATLHYPGFGSFDHWSKGNGFHGDIPGATDATFNCS